MWEEGRSELSAALVKEGLEGARERDREGKEKKKRNGYGKVLGKTDKTGSVITILLRLGI